MFFAPAKRDPVASALGEKVRARRQRLNRALNQPAMAARISRPFFVAGRAWSGFVIADHVRGYCASVERDGGGLLRNAIEETFGSTR